MFRLRVAHPQLRSSIGERNKQRGTSILSARNLDVHKPGYALDIAATGMVGEIVVCLGTRALHPLLIQKGENQLQVPFLGCRAVPKSLPSFAGKGFCKNGVARQAGTSSLYQRLFVRNQPKRATVCVRACDCEGSVQRARVLTGYGASQARRTCHGYWTVHVGFGLGCNLPQPDAPQIDQSKRKHAKEEKDENNLAHARSHHDPIGAPRQKGAHNERSQKRFPSHRVRW